MSLSAFLPNASVSVLRTPFSTDDGYGGPVDDETPVPGMANVPASLRSRQTRVWDPEQQRYMSVTTFVVRFRPGADVQQYDRLKDATGNYYAVSDVNSNRGVNGASDVVVMATTVQ